MCATSDKKDGNAVVCTAGRLSRHSRPFTPTYPTANPDNDQIRGERIAYAENPHQ